MFRYIYLTFVLAVVVTASAEDRNLEEFYNRIDRAIELSPSYVSAYESKIQEAKDTYAKEVFPQTKLSLLFHIFELYKAYSNDSALAYIQRYIDEAEVLGLTQEVYRGKVKMAFQCSSVGLYTESLGILEPLVAARMDKDIQVEYYKACMHVYGELSYYTRVAAMHDYYDQQSRSYRDSVFLTAAPDSEDYLLCKETELRVGKKYDEALKVNDQRMRLVKENTRDFAIVCYYRYLIYQESGNKTEGEYWLVQSALTDVNQVVMDQAALLSLAELLNGRGDLERSYRYIRFTYECNNRFNTRMRSWQITPILTVIENNYKREMEHSRNVLVGSIILVSILALLLLVAYLVLRHRNSQLAEARNALHHTNEQLANLNVELQQANCQLSTANERFADINARLSEAHRVKDEYIGRFLSLCSQYVDKLDDYRKMVNRKMKNKELDELYRITKSSELKEQEIEELNMNFDKVFLHLFPTFVEEFNDLLVPELQIRPKEEGRLTTDLRIFALIRLGIDDSSKIAEFLHYSVNTVYNYRARIKNGAVDNRELFEKKVKDLGIVK